MRRFFRVLPLALAWLLLCQLLWGWVFVNFLTDTAPENKLVVYIDAKIDSPRRLSAQLEEQWGLRDTASLGIKLIQLRELDYAMMAQTPFDDGDVYIVDAAHFAEYEDRFAFLPEALAAEHSADEMAFSAKAEARAIIAEILPALSGTAEFRAQDAFYLCLGAHSVHLEDGAALECLRMLLSGTQSEP